MINKRDKKAQVKEQQLQMRKDIMRKPKVCIMGDVLMKEDKVAWLDKSQMWYIVYVYRYRYAYVYLFLEYIKEGQDQIIMHAW